MEHTEADLMPVRLTIASTFTCDPLVEILEFWSEKFELKSDIFFSPYDQVSQELLNRNSLLNHPENDARLVFVKFDDWLRNISYENTIQIHSHILDNISSLCKFVKVSAAYGKSPLFLTIARNSKDSTITPEKQTVYEELLRNKLLRQTHIIVTTSAEIDEKYPVADHFDAQRDQLGHIPYKRDYFTALTTSVFRKVLAGTRNPYKVIVLDCDNTLWGGTCGEVGPDGILLTEPYKKLQLFMLKQMKSGKILCLCSKNVQEDVDRVFSERPDMVLQEHDIVSSKINWKPKSHNIRKLSEELNLGLNSFIFLDDNPVECAEVRAHCPEVLTLNLPDNPEDFTSFLDHTWAFDFGKTTHLDEQRTKLYKDDIKRAGYKNDSSTLKEFIEGLNLNILIKDAAPDELSRVSQLSYRTNQFNFTTIRRSEKDIKELIETEGFTCKVCRVKDRFGDYGLVGALLFHTIADRIVLDSFMLSCRILGRGVEHMFLQSVGEAALELGLKTIQINYQKSGKNQPAMDFLKSVSEDYSGTFSLQKNDFKVTSAFLGNLKYDPDKQKPDKNVNNLQSRESTLKAPAHPNGAVYEQIAKHLNSATKISLQLKPGENATGTIPSESVPLSNKNTEQLITQIWEEILDIKNLGTDQHFFDVGGTSLKAIEVLSRINTQFHKNLSIVSLFEHSTIRSLAHLVEDKPNQNNGFNKIIEKAAARRDRISRRD